MSLQKINTTLKEYQPLIGFLILAMLVTTSFLLLENNERYEEILETGGYTEGVVRCACTEEAWQEYQIKLEEINISGISYEGEKE